MKTIFAALASALLVSTAFAQTAAPASSTAAATAAAQAGQTDTKASTEVQAGTTKTDASTNEAGTAPKKVIHGVHSKKKSVEHGAKTQGHKLHKKEQSAETGADKAKSGAATETGTAPVKADVKTDAAVKAQ